MRAPLSKFKSPAYFFKFIKPGLVSQLSIPISFRRYIKGRGTNTTAILKRGSKKWFVKINDWSFSEGWDNFVRENGVQEFDMVVFMHEGDMVFNTMVFDHTQCWCEREYSYNQVTESSWKREINTNALKEIPKEKSVIPDHSHHPSFTGTLSASCKYKLYLPYNFTSSNGLRIGKMILRNGRSQMSWTVAVMISSKKYTRIGKGWHDFYMANGLKEGDHFKLELIQTGIKPVANFYSLSTRPLAPTKTPSSTSNNKRDRETAPTKTPGSTPNNKNNPKYPALTMKQSESHGMVGTRSFIGTLQEYDNSRKRMYIPKKFAVENGLNSGELILKNAENEGSWTVDFRNRLDRFYYVHSGLREFCIANGLEKGDTVKFELIQNGEKPVAMISRTVMLQ